MFRSKNLRTSVAAAAALASLMTMAACTGAEKASDKGAASAPAKAGGGGGDGTYYWISQNSTLPLFVAHDHPAWNAAAEELGVKAELVGPTTIDLAAFISTINQICAQKPAGVAVVGWDPSLTAAVNKCVEQGVPTVTDDADLPDSKRLAFIGTDWCQIGVAQAKAMIEATGGTGKIATLSIINADNMVDARRCFESTLADSTLEIVAEEDDGGDAAQAASKTASLLAAYPDLVGIAGFDSESGAGAVRALTEAGKIGEVKVTAMEQTPEFFQTVKDGSVSAIIIQKRALFTYYALKTLYDYNNNGLSIGGLSRETTSTVPQFIDTGLVVATKENIDEVLKAAKVS